jgi:hypothetical protein
MCLDRVPRRQCSKNSVGAREGEFNKLSKINYLSAVANVDRKVLCLADSGRGANGSRREDGRSVTHTEGRGTEGYE